MGRHYQRGSMLFALGRYSDAVDAFTEELDEQPESAIAFAMRAASWLNCGQTRKASRDVHEAIRLAPELGYAHYVLSCIHSRQGSTTKAEKSIREALRLERNPTYFYRLAEIDFLRNRFDRSLEFVDEGLATNPTHVDCLLLRAKNLSALGRQLEAKSCLLAALSRHPSNPAAHQTLGQITLEVGDTAEARDALREARRLNPIHHNDRDALAAAYGRLLWPLSMIDRRLVRFQSWSPTRRWMLMAGLSTMLLLISICLHEHPSVAAPILILAFNAFAGSMTIDFFAIPLGKVAFRRDLDVPWYALIPELIRPVAAVITHIGATLAALICTIDPALAVLLLGFAVNFELILAFVRKARLPAKLVGGLVGFFLIATPFTFAAALLTDEVSAVVGGLTMWAVSLLFSYLLTSYWR
jgi:Flp pilus assembly protein TadD